MVIPTYNSASTIHRCLDSIVGQTVTPKEVLIVDRFSIDGTLEIAKKFGAKVIQANANRSLGRNIGLKESGSDGIIFVDADMRLAQDLVGECSRRLEECQALVIPEISFGEGFWAKCKSLERQTHLNSDLEAARCFRRTALLALGGYDPTLEAGEDWDLHNRANALGLSIGRTEARILHDEGDAPLLGILRKKYFYGATLGAYMDSYPQARKTQLNPIRRIIYPTFKVMPTDPLHGIGVLILKSLEFIVAGFGLLTSTVARKLKKRTPESQRPSNRK